MDVLRRLCRHVSCGALHGGDGFDVSPQMHV
jgi:hypothetical protein